MGRVYSHQRDYVGGVLSFCESLKESAAYNTVVSQHPSFYHYVRTRSRINLAYLGCEKQ